MRHPGTDAYLESVGKGMNGETQTIEEFLNHFDVQNNEPGAGVEVGTKAPHFVLEDQEGKLRTIADLSGPKGLLLVFVRSANWCGYCRNQLAELKHAVNAAAQRGINIAAIAPDHPVLVRKFADFAGVKYPLLSDPQAHAIEGFGILNHNIPPHVPKQMTQHTEGISGRVPFPAHFLIAPDGTVIAKSVCNDLRHRPSGTALVFSHFSHDPSDTRIEIETHELSAEIAISSARVQAGQEIAVSVTLTPAPGVYIYGAGVPEVYTPVDLSFSDTLVAEQALHFPPAEELRLEAIGETLPLYRRPLTAQGMIRLKWSPPVHASRYLRGLEQQLADMATAPGAYELVGVLTYQACIDEICIPPQSIQFSLPLEILPDLGRVEATFKDERESVAHKEIGDD